MTTNLPNVPTAPIRVADPMKRREMELKSQEAMLNSFAWACCINCESWNETLNICEKFGEKPPTKVITTGCIEYSPLIPF